MLLAIVWKKLSISAGGVNNELRRLSTEGSSSLLNTIEAKANLQGGLSFGGISLDERRTDELLRLP